MFIGYLKTVIHIPHSSSLKDKRQVVSKIKQKARNKFNIAVSEKPSDKWQVSELSFVCINYSKKCVEETMHKIESFMQLFNDIYIVETEGSVF